MRLNVKSGGPACRKVCVMLGHTDRQTDRHTDRHTDTQTDEHVLVY